MILLGIDIGGSSVKYGCVSYDKQRRESLIDGVKTRKLDDNNFESLRNIIFEIVNESNSINSNITIIGISTTGSVKPSGFVRNAGHFDGYRSIDWEEVINNHFNSELNVYTVNDGRAFAIAEYHLLDTKPSSLANFVVGTGIGGGLILNGKPLPGNTGTAGAFGHIKISNTSPIYCSCKKKGCVEAFASGTAIGKAWELLKGSSAISDVAKAYVLNDKQAIKLVKGAAESLGLAIANVISTVEPEVIVIGGGVLKAFELEGDLGNPYFELAVDEAKKQVFKRVGEETTFIKSKNLFSGGVLGAAIAARDYFDK